MGKATRQLQAAIEADCFLDAGLALAEFDDSPLGEDAGFGIGYAYVSSGSMGPGWYISVHQCCEVHGEEVSVIGPPLIDAPTAELVRDALCTVLITAGVLDGEHELPTRVFDE
jgi:hypothetical protein